MVNCLCSKVTTHTGNFEIIEAGTVVEDTECGDCLDGICKTHVPSTRTSFSCSAESRPSPRSQDMPKATISSQLCSPRLKPADTPDLKKPQSGRRLDRYQDSAKLSEGPY
jgi:hypothetical protein